MTPEVQNEIISQFWGIVPTIIIIVVVAAALGIGYKILEKKLLKKDKQNNSKNNQK